MTRWTSACQEPNRGLWVGSLSRCMKLCLDMCVCVCLLCVDVCWCVCLCICFFAVCWFVCVCFCVGDVCRLFLLTVASLFVFALALVLMFLLSFSLVLAFYIWLNFKVIEMMTSGDDDDEDEGLGVEERTGLVEAVIEVCRLGTFNSGALGITCWSPC